ncbi:carboxypeptidase regulatory-like domain-containing protein [candidate division WOR-3 bacterium]|nr:carboxypeptidase regulatory-like domain-containing protein [candidate division WOR-3 bacterium]
MGPIRPVCPIPSRTVLSLVLAAACCLGAEARVRLRVRDGDTGRSLAGVKVKLGESVLVTGADGGCVVPAVAGTRLVLTASAEGFYTATDTIAVTAADERSVFRLYGTKPRTAIGFVKDGSTGKRLARALVRVKGETATARSDSTGMYAIPFPPGDRELLASLPGFRGFPRRLSVRAGDTLSVDLPLYDTALAVGEVAGRVEVQGFGAAIGASVTIEGTRLGTASNRNGDYIITGIPAGRRRLIFTYAGCKKAMRVVNVSAWKILTLNVQLERRPPGSGY